MDSNESFITMENDPNLTLYILMGKLCHHENMHSCFSKNGNASPTFYYKNWAKVNANGKLAK